MSKRKKIALYYPWCYLKSGVERVILETVRRSRHDFTIFTNYIDFDQTFPEFRSLANLVRLREVPVQRSFAKVLQAAWIIATQKLDLSGFDALLVQSEGLGDFVTLRNGSKPILCFCHTPVRPIYDPVYKRKFLENHPGKRIPLAAYSFFYRILNRATWRNYRHIFANSAEVRGRILAGGLCDPSRIEVLNPGVDLAAAAPGGVSDRYFLYAGRIKWTKNVYLAVQSFQEFRRKPGTEGWRLVVAGGVDKASQDYFAQLRAAAGADPSIEFRLDPTGEEMHALYDRCHALLYPPLNEDWGIVPIEAMAHGKPVLAVDSGGPRETVLDGVTGYLLPPAPEAFADRMHRLAQDSALSDALGKAAAERARKFTWDAFVSRLDDYIDEHC